MNIYIKLQQLRKEFNSREIKKSGENKFAGFKYFELKDILPVATELLEKYKMTTIMNCNKEGATLTLINGENPEELITFEVPNGDCNLKGCHEIQNVGAVITYQKRYLYVNLLDIVENDVVDRTSGVDAPIRKLSEAQVNRLIVIANKAGFNKETVMEHIKKRFNKEKLDELTKAEYDAVCEGYESLKK